VNSIHFAVSVVVEIVKIFVLKAILIVVRCGRLFRLGADANPMFFSCRLSLMLMAQGFGVNRLIHIPTSVPDPRSFLGNHVMTDHNIVWLVASFAPEFQANRSKIVGRYWSFH
jgi:hypothetical protein